MKYQKEKAREQSHLKSHQGLPWWSSGKESPYNAGDEGQGTKIPHATGQLSPRATTTELVSTREPACRKLQSPCTLEPTHHNKREGRTSQQKISHASTKIPCAATKTRCSQK